MRVLFNKIVTLGSIYSNLGAISQNVFSIFPLRPKGLMAYSLKYSQYWHNLDDRFDFWKDPSSI